ncbi:hypothetical protein QUA82_06270 [Microcoleus sp. F8-D3]
MSIHSHKSPIANRTASPHYRTAIDRNPKPFSPTGATVPEKLGIACPAARCLQFPTQKSKCGY